MFWIHGMFLIQEGWFYTGLNRKISFKDKFYELLGCWVRYLKIYLKVHFLCFNVKTTFISMSSAGNLLMRERLIERSHLLAMGLILLHYYIAILWPVFLHPSLCLSSILHSFCLVNLLHLITSVLFLNLIIILILNHYAKILVSLLIHLSSRDCYL